MSHIKALGVTAALLISTAAPAAADVTSKLVWDKWRALAESTGQTITVGSENMSGDSLQLTDLKMEIATPEVSVVGTIGEVNFADQPNGTVLITMSPSYDLVITGTDGSDSASLTMSMLQEGLSIVASGDEAQTNYDFKASTMSLSSGDLVVDGDTIEMDIGADLGNIKGRYQLGAGEAPPLDGTFLAATAAMRIIATNPESDGKFEFVFDMADLNSSFSGVMAAMDPENMAASLKAGFAIDSEFSHGPANYKLDFSERGDEFHMTASESAGSVSTTMSAAGLSYSIGDSDLSVSMSGSEIPFPQVSMSVGKLLLGLTMPVSASETPEDLAIVVRLEDLAVSDMIWGMLDPSSALPHDPATLIVDIAGKANWFFDIMDPAAAEKLGDGMPGELHNLALAELRLAIAGAELTGAGEFEFDNSDLMTFGGVPKPTGAVDLTLVGGNGLMDKLVQMGLVPEDQAMAARMMLGLFARPGGGEDTLTSKIEITEDGAIMANGQRLQ